VYTFVLTIGDWIFSWLLFLQRDVAIIVLGTTSGVLLAVCRRAFTNARRGHQIQADLGVLKTRIGEARQSGDAGSTKRYRNIRNWVRWRRSVNELPALLVAFPVLLTVAVWMDARMVTFNPLPGEEIRFDLPFGLPPVLLFAIVSLGAYLAVRFCLSPRNS